MALPPVCILAGGLGTRLKPISGDLPKPIVQIAGRPFLEHQLQLLRDEGAERVVMCVGYRGELIEKVIGDGSRFDLSVTYAYDGDALRGTAGAVRNAIGGLGPFVLVMYGDTFLPTVFHDVVDAFHASGQPALMTVLEDPGALAPANATFDGALVRYDKYDPPAEATWVDYGLMMFRTGVFDQVLAADLAEVLTSLSKANELAGYAVSEWFYEIGTPEAFQRTERYLLARRAVTNDAPDV